MADAKCTSVMFSLKTASSYVPTLPAEVWTSSTALRMADSTLLQKFVNQIAAIPNLKIDYVVLNAGVLRYPNVSRSCPMSGGP